jgi:hypothetical protein
MLGMRERARKIGADYSCDTAPGRGTRVTVQIRSNHAYMRDGWFSSLVRSLRDFNSAQTKDATGRQP